MKRKKILITNDDGVFAPGIRFLIDIAKEFGDIVVVAPDKPQSGTGHAITFADPLRIKCIEESENYVEYSCSGTPVDCVKMAEYIAFKDHLPDLLVSGVNHGSNASINIIYSGTMAAVIEAHIDNIPSIGFSMNSYSHKTDLEPARPFIRKIIKDILEKGMPADICLNVNIPHAEQINGIRISRQAKASWKESFDNRIDPRGGHYYWLTGHFHVEDQGEGTDIKALADGYIAVVPIQIDLTAHGAMKSLKFLED
jgi:5'-nucleotidase